MIARAEIKHNESSVTISFQNELGDTETAVELNTSDAFTLNDGLERTLTLRGTEYVYFS